MTDISSDNSRDVQRNSDSEPGAENGRLAGITTAAALALSLFSFEAFGAERGADREEDLAVATQPAENLSGFYMPAIKAESLSELSLSEGIERITPSPEALQWMNVQAEIATNSIERSEGPLLIDGTTFLTANSERMLYGFVGTRDRATGFSFRSIDENGYKFAFVKPDGETWYVSEAPHYRDQFPNGIPFSQTSLEIWKKGSEKLVQKEFPTSQVFTTGSGRGGGINFQGLLRCIEKAEANRKSEVRDAATVRGIELSGEPTGYIGMVDSNASDPIMACLINDTRFFPQMMNSLKNEAGEQRYNLVSEGGSDYIEVKESPYQMLRDRIKSMHEKGIDNFYLNFAGHGNQHGIFFSSDVGYQVLTPDQLHAVFSEFKDCKFTVDTVACYGGGMAEKMKSYQDPAGVEGRILMKLQAKPYSYNQEGRLEGQFDESGVATPYSSYYHIFNAHFLMQGLDFGEAHYQADIASKKLIPCDAEAWRSSGTGGNATLRE